MSNNIRNKAKQNHQYDCLIISISAKNFLNLINAPHKIKTAFIKIIHFDFNSDSLSTTITEKFKRQSKKISRELTVLKKQLAEKQPIKSQNLYEKYHHKQIYQKIQTQIQSFFYKRPYDIQNFNFLIHLLIEQRKFHSIENVLTKMKMINIEPDSRTYNHLIRAAAMQGNIQKCQQNFKQASKLFRLNKYFYTSLILCYSNTRNSQMANAIFKEMIQKGISPELTVYTCLINCNRIGRNLPKCWELHKQVVKSGQQMDEVYVGVMMKVYAASHDTQKCIKLYKQNIMDKGIKPTVQTKNSYLKALSSRKQYSNDAIELFFKMYQTGDFITEQTVRWTLRACSAGANLRSATQILKIMKLCKINPTKQIYNSLFRVYGKVCELPELSENYRQVILIDSFKLLEQVQRKNMVDTTILNNMLYVFAASDQTQKIDGLILPLYERFGLEYNPYTYQILMQTYVKKKNFNTAIRIWTHAKSFLQQKKSQKVLNSLNLKLEKNHISLKQQNRETFNMMHMYLDIGIQMMEMPMVLDALNMFKKINRSPKNQTLKHLGTMKNLPEQILTSLMEFQIRFGNAKLSKKNEGHKNDPQNK